MNMVEIEWEEKQREILCDKQGFTLVELLAIIAIIGILMGAILVTMLPVRERSERNALMKTMGTIVRAAGACDEVTYDTIPPLAGQPICNPSQVGIIYPVLDPRLSSKGYSYAWSIGHDLIGIRNGEHIISCSVGSGSCEAL